jgi:hypothetical protein
MSSSSKPIDVYLEIGSKRTFAGAIEWPGWCRSGRDERAAIEALFEYGPRFERAIRGTSVRFAAPGDAAPLRVVERLKGDATTDFGAPSIPPAADARPTDRRALARQEAILQACWAAFDVAAERAASVELTKGPRGGGRDLAKIVEHVLGADAGYLTRLGGKHPRVKGETPDDEMARLRQEILDALDAAPRSGTAPPGPRGGKRWTARFFIRRSAWHILDHGWEIEDRVP